MAILTGDGFRSSADFELRSPLETRREKSVRACSTIATHSRPVSDGVITEAEYEFFTTAITRCFAALDLDASFDTYGTLSYNNPRHVAPERTDKCNTDNGIRVVILRNAMIRNPDRIDENELMTLCLRASGVISDDYTADDLTAGIDFDRIYATDEFGECTLRPFEIIDESRAPGRQNGSAG